MRGLIRFRFAVCICFLLSTAVASRGQNSASSGDPVLRAMVDELGRSVSELQFKDLEKPYFIQYIVLDQEHYRASASFGALTGSDLNRVRFVQAQVRVGDYDFDNSEFVTGPNFQGPPAGVTSQTVIDNVSLPGLPARGRPYTTPGRRANRALSGGPPPNAEHRTPLYPELEKIPFPRAFRPDPKRFPSAAGRFLFVSRFTRPEQGA